MEFDEDERVWWLGRLPAAWGYVVACVAALPVLAWLYARSGIGWITVGLAATMMMGFALRGLWDSYRPWLTWDCRHCQHHDGDVDPRRLGRRASYHTVLNHAKTGA